MTKHVENKTLVNLMKIIKGASISKQNYRNKIQEALIVFIKEYNGALTYNLTPFKAIVETVGNDVKALKNFLDEYTNITKVKADLSFETDVFETKTDAEGNEYKVYTLAFKETFDGQKWWECAPEKPEIILSDETFEKSLKALIKKYTNEDKPVNLNDESKAILTYLKSKVTL